MARPRLLGIACGPHARPPVRAADAFGGSAADTGRRSAYSPARGPAPILGRPLESFLERLGHGVCQVVRPRGHAVQRPAAARGEVPGPRILSARGHVHAIEDLPGPLRVHRRSLDGEQLGLDAIRGAVRFGIGPFNTEAHIDAAIEAVRSVAALRIGKA